MSKGFTLIEVLVSLAVLLVVITSTFVGFSSFTRTQKLNSSVDGLRNALNEAKSSALSQTIRSSSSQCANSNRTLVGDQMVFTASTYEIKEVCKDSAIPPILYPYSIGKITTLPTGVTFNPVPASFTFLVQAGGGGIDQATDQTLTLVSGSSNKQVVVTSTGIIK